MSTINKIINIIFLIISIVFMIGIIFATIKKGFNYISAIAFVLDVLLCITSFRDLREE